MNNCECLNYCGDDEKVKTGYVKPCEFFKRCKEKEKEKEEKIKELIYFADFVKPEEAETLRKAARLLSRVGL